MDRLNKVIEDFEKSVTRLEEAISKTESSINTEDYPFFRDSAIQRFEFTFEIMWKAIKLFLEKEGIICRSPRNCIRELFSTGFISEEDTKKLLFMLEDRNATVHTYKETIAEEIFKKLPLHLNLAKKVLKVIKENTF
ncbi:HI0074 family nucleotidyltransferase substrate-binding subunit [Desulfurobacterium atlanticum]|uniref:Nucleotidyltransferase substrate binding protein, HI0074 family n=1 Tax=Desulfurobacterium atlanticum TaxID=240169 RepID=A0A238XSP2_9BACT|nr:HI0074 family nucleotidyltransferase substrate-binding subunit [Desulfurobacterium atlanticum]SNR61029.1 nucleotidyltransferase substrate binding protein, HI0074 family [Desulfurobacterium atlanticum]